MQRLVVEQVISNQAFRKDERHPMWANIEHNINETFNFMYHLASEGL